MVQYMGIKILNAHRKLKYQGGESYPHCHPERLVLYMHFEVELFSHAVCPSNAVHEAADHQDLHIVV